MNVVLAMLALVLNSKTILFDILLEIRNRSRNSAPVSIADGGVNPANDFAFAQLDVAQVARLKEHRKRPGPQRDDFRQWVRRPVAEEVAKLVRSHRAAGRKRQSTCPSYAIVL